MDYTVDQHVLVDARFVESPNQSDRPSGSAIELLVIHNISLPPGEFGTGCIAELFCNTLDYSAHGYFASLVDLKVSSHLLIDRRGVITQFVPFDRQAWHAGKSVFQGRADCNEFSIGIELEGTDTDSFTPVQYASLIDVTNSLLREYSGLTKDRIVGHSDIAPERKTDPGPCFDWHRYRAALQADIVIAR